MNRAQASAAAKIILLGEHAVVYGQPALAAPIDRQVLVTTWVDGSGSDQPTANAEPVPEVPFRDAFAALGVHAARFTSESGVPRSSGFGTSAAFAAAIIRALASAKGRSLSASALWELTTGVERHYHGSSSGLDPASVLAHGPILFRKGTPPSIEPVRGGADWSFVVCVVSPRASTRELVDGLARRSAAEPERFQATFARIGAVVEVGREAIERNDGTGFGAAMNENQALLRQVGVSSPELDDWCSRAVKAGALGAKLTGAGGGGTAIALTRDPSALGQQLAMPQVKWFTARLGNVP